MLKHLIADCDDYQIYKFLLSYRMFLINFKQHK